MVLELFWKCRVVLFYLIVSLFVLLFVIFICLPAALIDPSYNIRFSLGRAFSYVYIHLLRLTCGLSYCVENIELLPNEPYIAVPNHQSFWENFAMQLIVRKHALVIKQELLDIPIFGWGLRLGKPIAIDRNAMMSVKQILDQGMDRIKHGMSLVIFPEGTRVKPGQNIALKPSAAKLAIMARVPMAIIVLNSGYYWPKGFWIIKNGTIKVKIVEVISKERVATFQDAHVLNAYVEAVMHKEKEKLF